mmetsp:Transcript_1523/g.2734  ORF Transcript_1523/g.2734 Transcript_1523/m.2734 type:complete len:113 (-) Transcript_1523:683-1021(-)
MIPAPSPSCKVIGSKKNVQQYMTTHLALKGPWPKAEVGGEVCSPEQNWEMVLFVEFGSRNGLQPETAYFLPGWAPLALRAETVEAWLFRTAKSRGVSPALLAAFTGKPHCKK